MPYPINIESGNAPWLWNQDSYTPFDNMDSLDRLELKLIIEESGIPTLVPPDGSGIVGGTHETYEN
jgi:hypothetical protein